MSGHQDSNLGPPAPKAGALTGLRYAPKIIKNKQYSFLIIYNRCGGGGIRTRGTGFPVRQFSKLVVSATHPLHRVLILK